MRLLASASLVAALCLMPGGVTSAGEPEPSTHRKCNDLPVTIVGTPGADVIEGSEGVDVIFAGDGADVVNGHGGDDHICGGRDGDVIDGGDGVDWLFGEEGRDELSGSADTDVMHGSGGNDQLDGGSGVDYLHGDGGDDALNAGSDTAPDLCYTGSSWCEELDGGPGDDVIDGGTGDYDDAAIYADPSRGMRVNLARGTARGMGHDTLISIEAVNIGDQGGVTSDRVIGTSGADVLWTGGGVDVIRGRGGDDYIGDWHDWPIDGGDDIRSGAGNDLLVTTDGDDTISTGPGDDTIGVHGSSGGTVGRNIHLGRGDDTLTGGVPDATPFRVWGGRGADHLNVSGFALFLYGGPGSDNLTGGSWHDLLDGGSGMDIGYGGPGEDTCISIEEASFCEL